MLARISFEAENQLSSIFASNLLNEDRNCRVKVTTKASPDDKICGRISKSIARLVLYLQTAASTAMTVGIHLTDNNKKSGRVRTKFFTLATIMWTFQSSHGKDENTEGYYHTRRWKERLVI